MNNLFVYPFDNILFSVVLPFLIIFTILWGTLSTMKVFGRKVNFTLALALSLLVASTKYFTLFSTYLAQYGALTAMLAFGAVFLFGIIAFAIGRGREIYYETDYYKARERIIKKIGEIDKKIEKFADKDEHKAAALQKEKRALEDRLAILEAKARK